MAVMGHWLGGNFGMPYGAMPPMGLMPGGCTSPWGMNPFMGGMNPYGGMNPFMGGMNPYGGMNPFMGGMNPYGGMNPFMGGMPDMGMALWGQLQCMMAPPLIPPPMLPYTPCGQQSAGQQPAFGGTGQMALTLPPAPGPSPSSATLPMASSPSATVTVIPRQRTLPTTTPIAPAPSAAPAPAPVGSSASVMHGASAGQSRLGSQVPSKIRQWEPLIMTAAQRHNVDPNLLAAVMNQESGGNPTAVSRAGAAGLMQLMPRTAEGLGLSDAERLDPAKNVDAGARLLRRLLDRYNGDVSLTLAAYNAGAGSVQRHNGIPPFAETQRYVPNVLAKYEQFRAG